MTKNIPRILGVIIVGFILIAIFACSNETEHRRQSVLKTLLQSPNLRFIQAIPLLFHTYHVQGLEITERFYFVTSVDKSAQQSWLLKINRKDGSLVVKKNLTDSTFIHPGGLQFDGDFLWLPNAEYDRDGPSMILALDLDSLHIHKKFKVADHIGAVAANSNNHLYGVNWDARQFYVWDYNGNELHRVDSPTAFKYQDLKFVAGKLLCSGLRADTCAVDIIDPQNWKLLHRIHLPQMEKVQRLSREGMAFDGRFYFLPEDAPNSRIFIFLVK